MQQAVEEAISATATMPEPDAKKIQYGTLQMQVPYVDGGKEFFELCGHIYRNKYWQEDLKAFVPDPQCIVDGGAGAGHWYKEAKKIWPNADFLCFEPRGFNWDFETKGDRIQTNVIALGANPAERELFLTTNIESSSFLKEFQDGPLNKYHKVVGSKTCRIERLDNWGPNIDIIKLDVQGYELEALKGATESLKHAKALYIEVSFKPSYKDQPLVDEIDAFLDQHGFERRFIYATSFPDVYANALYLRKGENGQPRPKIEVTDRPIRLDIGCGETRIPGYTPIDATLGHDALKLDYPDESVDEIRASHILEHFTFSERNEAATEWFRVLKPGGIIKISVPNMANLDLTNPQWPFFVMGGQNDEHDFHKSCYDKNLLSQLLASRGFQEIEDWTGDAFDTSSQPISLNVKARKPNGQLPTEQTVKMCAVTSIPRLGWNDHWGCIVEGLRPFQIPIRRYTGAYWDQCFQTVLESCIADGLDWVLTLDYDTMFTAKHLDKMFGIFGSNPHIDALAPIERKRNDIHPLATVEGKTQVEITSEPIKVNTAHFGCTLIRCDALKEIPKPWFLGVPNPDGTWAHKGDPNRLDPDIYFWDKWAKHGKTIYLAPRLVVGHLELMVSEYDEQMNPIHTPVGDWIKREKV